MQKIVHIVSFILIMAATPCLQAQTGSTEVNRSVQVQTVAFPYNGGKAEGLSFVDGRLCFRVGDMMYSAPVAHGTACGIDVDVSLMQLDKDMNYVVRHPGSGRLYYTKMTKRRGNTLYECITEGRKPKAEQVKLPGFEGDISHPTFNHDGSIMVFQSRGEDATSGSDLWFSFWNGSEWSTPQTLGATVNSTFNECAPFISGEYLFFSSNRNRDNPDDYDIYACRLVSVEQVHGDTVFRYPIGRGKVQTFMAPFNSKASDEEFIYNTDNQCGFWLRHDSTNLTQPYSLHSFTGQVTGVHLKGSIRGEYISTRTQTATSNTTTLSDVNITVYANQGQNGTPLFTTRSNTQGTYSLYLQPNKTYTLVFQKKGYFKTVYTYYAQYHNGDLLFEPVNHNVTLTGYLADHDYVYNNELPQDYLFEPAVATHLSAMGCKRMDTIAQYLIDNPHLHLYVTAVFTAHEERFNKLVAYAREDAIEQYLWRQGVPAQLLNDAKYETITSMAEGEELNNAILFFFSEDTLRGAADDMSWSSNKNSLQHFLDADEEEPQRPVRQWQPGTKKPETPTTEQTEPQPSTTIEKDLPADEEEEEPAQLSPEFLQLLEGE